MHFWGLTVDVISCVNLEIAIGLTVDYSAHVAHTFLIQKGRILIKKNKAMTFNYKNIEIEKS